MHMKINFINGTYLLDSELYFLYKFLFKLPSKKKGFLLEELFLPETDLTSMISSVSGSDRLKFTIDYLDKGGNLVEDSHLTLSDVVKISKDYSTSEASFYVYINTATMEDRLKLIEDFYLYLNLFLEDKLSIIDENILKFEEQAKLLSSNLIEEHKRYGNTFIIEGIKWDFFMTNDFLFFHTLIALDYLKKIDICELDIVVTEKNLSPYGRAKITVKDKALLVNTENIQMRRNDFNSSYITRDGDDFNYKGKPLPLSKKADYYKVFCALYALLPNGGEISYEDLTKEIKSRIPKTKSRSDKKMRKFIQANLTEKGNGFMRYSKLPSTMDNQKPIIKPNRGYGISFNNKVG